MPEEKKDNLEEFFRKRVERLHFDYREDDWKKLESKLDGAGTLKSGSLGNKIIWAGTGAIIATLLLLLIGLEQGFINFSNEINPDPQKVSTSSKKSINDLADDKSKHDLSNSINDSFTAIESPDQKTVGTNGQKSNINLLIESKVKKENKDVNVEKSIIEVPKEDQNQINATAESNPNVVSAVAATADAKVIQSKESRWSEPHISRKPSNILVNVPMVYLSFEQQKAAVEVLQLREDYAWNFAVAADFNAVGGNKFEGPGLRTGLFFEYYVFNRMSIGIGANYTVKNYDAYGRAYVPPKGFWTNGEVPKVTEGTCNVLDIPVNISYYIPTSKEQRFFIRGGISSWLMLKEKYNFEYKSNDPDLISSWQGKNENYHFFSILNFSAGFEQPLNQRMSLLVEPYLNIPLTGIGFGNVDLHSTGLKFALKLKHFKLSPQ